MKIRYTAHQIQARMQGRAAAIDGVVQRFLGDLASRVERGAVKNLSGSGAPGAYPVPRRTGTLWRGMGIDAPQRTASGWRMVVFNDTRYALAVHEGFHAYGNPNAPFYGPRRFLTDAIADANPAERLQQALEAIP